MSLGHVIVRHHVKSSTTLSLLSPGKQGNRVWAVGSTAPLSPPVTVMVISHPVFSQNPYCAINMPRAVTAVFVDSWFLMAVLTREPNFFFSPQNVLFLMKPTVLAGWVTHNGLWASSVLSPLAASLNGPPLSHMGNT